MILRILSPDPNKEAGVNDGSSGQLGWRSLMGRGANGRETAQPVSCDVAVITMPNASPPRASVTA